MDMKLGAHRKVEKWQLAQRQGLPLGIKIKMTRRRIEEFYRAFGGKVYVAYSGGKDSEVMLHLVRACYPEVKAVFVDTGTELDTRRHAIKKADVVLRPRIPMLQVWQKYGIPFPSEQQAQLIEKVRKTKSPLFKRQLLTGIMKNGSKTKTLFKVSKKWKIILDSDIKVSDRCCYYLKNEPSNRYQKQTGEAPFVGVMATDGMTRKSNYLQHGCINFTKKVCHPLGFWTEQDILMYIKKFDLDYCDAYGDIIEVNGLLKTTKADRTGCVGCGFGVHMEEEPNRFQRMEVSNPRLHNIILHKWCDGAMGKVLDLCNISYTKPKDTQCTLL